MVCTERGEYLIEGTWVTIAALQGAVSAVKGRPRAQAPWLPTNLNLALESAARHQFKESFTHLKEWTQPGQLV